MRDMKSVIECIQEGFASLGNGFSWLRDGFSTLSAAACGEYDGESEEMKALRQEIMTMDLSPRSDKLNLIKDRDNVRGDRKRAFERVAPELWPNVK
jgi:hypothetical protein